MESELDKLRGDLQRYRRLFNPYGCVTDRQVRNTLKELIDETEARLRVIEHGSAGDEAAQDIGRPRLDGYNRSDKEQFAVTGK
jgi:hypothetical protein